MKTRTKVFAVLLAIASAGNFLYAATFTTNLSLGSRGSSVSTVQQFLISKGLLTGSPTGYFGQQTKVAVQLFQKQNGLPVTGGWFALTRQKAEASTLSETGTSISSLVQTTNTPASTNVTEIKTSVTNPGKKEVTLTIHNTTGGFVKSADNTVTCYSGEDCKKLLPINTKITLKANPNSGYILKGWSEANCGTSLECTVPLLADTEVYVRYEVPKAAQRIGRFTSLNNSATNTCSITLGRDKCDLAVRWINNTGLDMTVKVNDDEYYLKVLDEDNSFGISGLDPKDEVEAITENSSGPIYFTLGSGLYKLQLRSGGNILDTATVEVKCAPGLFWDGDKCWEKGAQRMFIFKQEGGAITADAPGLRCGYRPDNCSAGFSGGSKVTLKANMVPGYTFDSWTGDCSGNQPTCTILMNGTKSVGFKAYGSRLPEVKPVTPKTSNSEIQKPVPGCTPNWQCDGWARCSNLKQTRFCYDVNSCNSTVAKPQTELSCEIPTWNLRYPY